MEGGQPAPLVISKALWRRQRDARRRVDLAHVAPDALDFDHIADDRRGTGPRDVVELTQAPAHD
jgi:hypothetical protein